MKADGEWIQELRKLSALEVGRSYSGNERRHAAVGVKENCVGTR